MAIDTPDYLASTSYTAILQSLVAFVPATPPVTIPVAQFSSLMASTINNGAGAFLLNLAFTAADGSGVGTALVVNPATYANVKIPVAGANVTITCTAGNGQLTLLGGSEELSYSMLAQEQAGGGDATGYDALTVNQPTTVGGDNFYDNYTSLSGEVYLTWTWPTAITGFLYAKMQNGATLENVNVASSNEGVAMPGGTNSLVTKLIALPAQPVRFVWRSNVANAAAQFSSVKIVKSC